MRNRIKWPGFALGLALAVTPAFADNGSVAPDAPKGAKGSVAITLDQLSKEVQTLQVQKSGIVVHYALPTNWQIEEQGKDARTGKLKSDMPVYVVVSRPPVANKNDPTDLIFELNVFDKGLMDDLPAGTPEDERKVGVQFRKFINAQMSFYIKSGFKVQNKAADLSPKPYGPVEVDPKTGKTVHSRPPTYFVPIYYDVPQDPKNPKSKTATLYTFNTFTGDKVWSLKFLVNKDRIDDYGGLITLVLNNSFGLTDSEYKNLIEATEAARKAAAAKGN